LFQEDKKILNLLFCMRHHNGLSTLVHAVLVCISYVQSHYVPSCPL